jgi:lipopolysaccharide/colanic/teichoic acid biosynthesis glycosyltransferase
MLLAHVSAELDEALTLRCRDLSSTDNVKPSAYHRWKSPLDRILAALLLLPALPIMAVLVVLVRLTSSGPGIYRQQRVGQDGRVFWLYKIRSMVHHAEAASGPVWTQKCDPRITRLGRVLRKLHLDEFPQLFNVLRGEMSLVGPRPERPEFVSILSEQIQGYVARLVVKPGITGLAQINLPPDTDLGSVRRKLILDVEYITEAGPLLDLQVMLCTAARLLGLPGELSMRPFRLRRSVHLDTPKQGLDTLRGDMPEREESLSWSRLQRSMQSEGTDGKSATILVHRRPK